MCPSVNNKYGLLPHFADCVDKSAKCTKYAKYCRNRRKVQNNCKATCNLCGKFKIISTWTERSDSFTFLLLEYPNFVRLHITTDISERELGGRLTQTDYENAKNSTFQRIAKGFEMNNDSSPNIFEGDIVLDDFDYVGEVTTDIERKWPKSGEFVIIPFTFPPDASEQQRADIARVVREFETKTCIRYKIKTRHIFDERKNS